MRRVSMVDVPCHQLPTRLTCLHNHKGRKQAGERKSPGMGSFVPPGPGRASGRDVERGRRSAGPGSPPDSGEPRVVKERTQVGVTPRHVSLVAVPDAVASTLFGIFDVINGLTLMGTA